VQLDNQGIYLECARFTSFVRPLIQKPLTPAGHTVRGLVLHRTHMYFLIGHIVIAHWSDTQGELNLSAQGVIRSVHNG